MEKPKKIAEIENKIIAEWKSKKDIKRLYEYVYSQTLTRSEKDALGWSDVFNSLAYAYHCYYGD